MENSRRNAPGKSLLKISGILLTIFGIVGIIGAIMIMTGGGFMRNMNVGLNYAGFGAIVGRAAIGLGFASLIGAGFELIMGILGIKNADRPEKARICLTFSIIAIALYVVIAILGAPIWSLIFGIALPVIYLIGAVRNKNVASTSRVV